MSTRRKIYEDDRRIYYTAQTSGLLVQYFKDQGSPNDENPSGSGAVDSRVSGHLMGGLNQIGVRTDFVRRLNMRELLVQEVEKLPISIVLRTIATESLAACFGVEEGSVLTRPLLEFYYHLKNQRDPIMVGEDHIRGFGWIAEEDLQDMISCALRANDFLSGVFAGVRLQLCEVRLHFGRLFDPVSESVRVLVTDGLAPDSLCLKDPVANIYLATLFTKEGKLVPMARGHLIAQRLGILSTPEEREKKVISWLKIFRGPRGI